MSDQQMPPPGGPMPPPGDRIPPPPPLLVPPPGYVGAHDQRFQRVGGIAKAIGVLLTIFIPLQVIGVFGLFELRDDARAYLEGNLSEQAFEDSSRTNLGSLAGILVIPLAVLTMILMFRMAKNLQVLGRPGATWSAGWAIGGWFCPPCAIYAIPWLMFRELWRGSDPAVAPGDASWKTGPVPAMINVWWVLYGLVPVIGLVTSAGVITNIQSLDTADLAERVDDFLLVNVALSLVSAVAAFVYLLMIRQLTARHVQSTGE